MEQNEEHIMMNILIYYAHETEQYSESYDAMNRAKKYADLEKNEVNPNIPDLDLAHGSRQAGAARRS